MTAPAQAPRRSFLRSFLLWSAVALGVCLFALASVIWSVVSLSRDARVLKNAVVSTLDAPVSTRAQVTAGPGLMGTARAAAAFIDGLPPEAAAALTAVRSASVGVYHLRQAAPDRRACIRASDARMLERGWRRIVGVNNAGATVLIYAPARLGPQDRLRLCLAVVNDRDVVIVSTALDAEALMPLVRGRIPAGGLVRL